jgi:predicted ATP-dependent endonuclease of OLD family
MFHHLKIEDVKVLKNATLLNLGKINVICGKNNSGKSTVLEGILSNDVVFGRTFVAEELKFLNKLPEISYPRRASSQNFVKSEEELDTVSETKNFTKKYVNLVEKLILKKPIWFSSERHDFADALEELSTKIYRKNIFEKITVRANELFMKEMEELNQVVKIPPIRQLASFGSFVEQDYSKLAPEKYNLLSHLYLLKNQERHSKDFKLFQKISEAFQKVSANHSFNITRDQKGELFLRFSFEEYDEIKADDCGLGLKDLLFILTFALSPHFSILLIEEAENHMHPDMQRKLLKYLAEETDKQYFITTHSSVFLNSTYADKVFFTKFENGEIKVSDATSRAQMLHSIGYSVTDNLVSDLIILVEGSGDKEIVEEFLSKMGLDAKYNIKIWSLGGDEMIHQDLTVFAQDYKIMALVDKDTQSESIRDEFAKNCRKQSIKLYKLKKYSIESYFSTDALNKVFNSYKLYLPEITGLSNADLRKLIENEPLWEKLGNNPARRKELKAKIKRKSREIAREMSLKDIEKTDLKNFFDGIQKTLQDLKK